MNSTGNRPIFLDFLLDLADEQRNFDQKDWYQANSNVKWVSTSKINENQSRREKRVAYRNSAIGFGRDRRHGISDRKSGMNCRSRSAKSNGVAQKTNKAGARNGQHPDSGD